MRGPAISRDGPTEMGDALPLFPLSPDAMCVRATDQRRNGPGRFSGDNFRYEGSIFAAFIIIQMIRAVDLKDTRQPKLLNVGRSTRWRARQSQWSCKPAQAGGLDLYEPANKGGFSDPMGTLTLWLCRGLADPVEFQASRRVRHALG